MSCYQTYLFTRVRRFSNAVQLLRNVDNAAEVVVIGRQPSRFKDPSEIFFKIIKNYFSIKKINLKEINDSLGPPGHPDQRDQAHDHGHRPEREHLRCSFLDVSRIVDQGRQPEHGLPAGQPHHEGDYVRRQAAVGVAVLLEVDHHQELEGVVEGRERRRFRQSRYKVAASLLQPLDDDVTKNRRRKFPHHPQQERVENRRNNEE